MRARAGCVPQNDERGGAVRDKGIDGVERCANPLSCLHADCAFAYFLVADSPLQHELVPVEPRPRLRVRGNGDDVLLYLYVGGLGGRAFGHHSHIGHARHASRLLAAQVVLHAIGVDMYRLLCEL